jgi:hypothetical protein
MYVSNPLANTSTSQSVAPLPTIIPTKLDFNSGFFYLSNSSFYK